MKLRIGQGFDVHAFGAGEFVTLGGVRVPHDQALVAHSDGDVLLHALCDALLGAAALGDIGRHFPDTDSQWAGVDSRVLLRRVHELLGAQGWRVVNVDSTLIAQRPQLAAHIPAMVQCISADLALPGSAVNVKATTTERLGFVGRGEGIAAQAVVLLTGVPDADPTP